MTNNIIIFTGENDFELELELLRWTDEFCKKYGPENVERLYAHEQSFTHILDNVSTLPLFSEKRLVIMYGLPCTDIDQFLSILSALHDQVVLVIVAPVLDKRLKLTKYIHDNLTVKNFELLSGKQCIPWIQKQAQQYGFTVENSVAQYMVAYIGDNQRLLDRELQKIQFVSAPVIHSTIDQYCIPNAEAIIWNLVDVIGKGDMKAALTLLESLYSHGESVISIWATYVWMLDQLQRVVLATRDGNANFGILMKEYGVKFGPAKSFIALAKRYDAAHANICSAGLQYDISIKSGGIHATDQNQIELQSVIDYLTVQLCALTTVR